MKRTQARLWRPWQGFPTWSRRLTPLPRKRGNLTPADVYFGRGRTILLQRERIKRQTIALRRLQHQQQAA